MALSRTSIAIEDLTGTYSSVHKVKGLLARAPFYLLGLLRGWPVQTIMFNTTIDDAS